MWLGSGVAVAVVWAGSYSSDSTPSLGTSICRGCSPKKTKKKKKKRKRKERKGMKGRKRENDRAEIWLNEANGGDP